MTVRAFSNLEASVEFSLRLFGELRESGILLGTLQTISCTRSIVLRRAVRQTELLRICRITLVNRREDQALLERLFLRLIELYFSSGRDNSADPTTNREEQALIITLEARLGEGTTADDEHDEGEVPGYSLLEVDQHKDFRLIPEHEFPAAMHALESIARKYAANQRRKTRRARRGALIDLRASLRESVKFDGDIVDWHFKKKIPTHTRLVLVIDVSGSMEIYSVFLLNFLHLLHRNRNFKIEVFVFSTELQPLTQYFRLKNFRDMLDNISRHFSGWSGGTRIGQALFSLNELHRSAVTKRTTLVIMSDGWDTGEAWLLEREMAKVSRRAKSVVWVNPLIGDPRYEPLAIGMATARPYCDEFISGHNLKSLKAVAAVLDL